MQVCHALAEAKWPGAVLTLGFFDGVHIGHQALLSCVRAEAHRRGGPAVVLTLWPHPRIVLGHSPETLRLINDLSSKVQLLDATGIDALVVLDFTLEIARQEPETFLDMIRLSPLRPSCIYMGYDHRFGRGGCGDFPLLSRYAQAHGLETRQGTVVECDGVPVSSTLVREALRMGGMERVQRMLGRSFAFVGTVEHGYQLGQRIGFPTANVHPRGEWQIVPAHGVYHGACRLEDGATFPAVINVGTRPTVNTSEQVSIEAHLLGFTGDLYGARMEVTFLRRLRDELKFSSLDDLKAQIARDVAQVAAYPLGYECQSQSTEVL